MDVDVDLLEYDSPAWEETVRRCINFFYLCAAVRSIQLNGTKQEIWLNPGNDPRWLEPYLASLETKLGQPMKGGGILHYFSIETPEMTVTTKGTAYHYLMNP